MLFANDPTQLNMAWDVLESIMKGVSAIDSERLHLTDWDEAESYLRKYGFDITTPADAAELKAIQQEAVSFIERRFLDADTDWQALGEPAPALTVPAGLADTDLRQILVDASTADGLYQPWCCALLKVMHTLCHMNNTVLVRYLPYAKAQILNRYTQAIEHTDTGELFLGKSGDLQLSILGFEVKDEKSRDSLLIKLLAKRENVAEEVFDMIGFRIITRTPAHAVLAMEILRRNKVLMFSNLIPSRSRNALIDFDDFKAQCDDVLEEAQWTGYKLDQTLAHLESLQCVSPSESFNPKNQHSLSGYRSIHITERQLIRVKLGEDIPEMRFFFPYELQIIDEANYLQSQSGSSAHTVYKQNQLIQARRRVLGSLFIAHRKLSKLDGSLL